MQKRILHVLSDHIPIVVYTDDLVFGYHLSRFFNIWCQDIDLHNLVKNSWRESQFSNGLLWDRLNVIKSMVSISQKSKCSMSSVRIKECKRELASLLTSSIHINEEELTSFMDKK